ncbi:MAG: MotE family protein [Henriciella sp.]|jgi:flagellar motility protein MotE (MotC chaperone)
MAIKAANRSNVLLTLGVLFTLGAATRLVPANVADAREADSDEKVETVSTKPEDAKATKAALPVEGQICFSEDLSEALAADQLRLETETEALAARELELQALEAELAETRADLTALQASLETRWEDMQAFAGEDLNHLAQMYGAMKPDQAATIFDQMDPSFAAGFLRLLSSEQAGLIMANMESQQAYIVSVRLASINEDLRREES